MSLRIRKLLVKNTQFMSTNADLKAHPNNVHTSSCQKLAMTLHNTSGHLFIAGDWNSDSVDYNTSGLEEQRKDEPPGDLVSPALKRVEDFPKCVTTRP